MALAATLAAMAARSIMWECFRLGLARAGSYQSNSRTSSLSFASSASLM
jgi:hypothetical protein